MRIDSNNIKCFGCSACSQKCPKKCIEMVLNSEGFLYPIIDESECIDCGMCQSVCPIDKGYDSSRSKCYAAYSKDNSLIENSSSGGLFKELAETVLQKEGMVYGAAFDNQLCLKHFSVENRDEIQRFIGSKYVQSDINETYISVKKNLKYGRDVLFCGTPCQIHGLKLFLKKDYDNLVLVDLVCHGVPSPKIFKDYINNIEKKKHIKIMDFKFRKKNKFGECYGFEYSGKKKNKIISNCSMGAFTPYGVGFFQGLCMRKSCYQCPYSSIKRSSDITLGDYWGIKKIHSQFANICGTSLILVNTVKGEKAISEIKSKINFIVSDINRAKKFNHNLQKATIEPLQRKEFFQDYSKYGYVHVENKYLKSFKIQLWHFRSWLGQIIRSILGK
ncbi:Coenzyme F420 hydrogenase/dehydrogenase, beta subunit C-terminal domain [Clostridium vincentii]|uniref:Ferredoxin n=1 Tax=Clostridium vincentii TaxID=52704 RepID=A0A2T0BJL6_9CLOT|nr:Coenzyme F420 hydrogenase/dehydrogenase, beta subunit C-terminal domain [Clostridium vincentii]PRR84088.1 Ferredoxin [Clostridium vincentii]